MKKWKDGRHYEGEFKKGKMDGHGEFKWDDGPFEGTRSLFLPVDVLAFKLTPVGPSLHSVTFVLVLSEVAL